MTIIAVLALVLAAFPALMTAVNGRLLRPTRPRDVAPDTLVSILIPARNEEDNIAAALDAALATRGTAFEVLVMDDASTDRTGEIVAAFEARGRPVRLLRAPPLPPGWSGKAHACQRLAEAASGTHLLFVDADVRLGPEGAAALAAHAQGSGAALVSGVPQQRTRTLGELLTVPTINLLIWGYLPVWLMRSYPSPALGAGCGQLMLLERASYFKAGGHGAVRMSLHDGVRLPRVVREHGLKTDLVAGAGLASCRMYRGLAEACSGFSKNATEGMATAGALPVWTVLLAGGHVLPFALAMAALFGAGPVALPFAAALLSLATRAAVTLRTRENPVAILLHPVTVLVALAIQWAALLRPGSRGATWRGRVYADL